MSDSDDFSDPIDPWARALSIVVGLGAAGTGSYAIFVSSNQAGTAVLLVLAAALLLIGLQGTPLIRFGNGDGAIQLARIRRRAETIIQRAQLEDPPEVAAAVVHAVQSAVTSGPMPQRGVVVSPYERSARHYKESLVRALNRVAPSFTMVEGHDEAVDIVVWNDPALRVGLVAMYHDSGPLSLYSLWMAQERAIQSEFAHHLIVITNAEPTSLTREHLVKRNGAARLPDVVTWRDAADDAALLEALTHLLGS